MMLGILLILAFGMFYVFKNGIYTSFSGDVQRIEAIEAQSILEQKQPIILDARTLEEFQTSHLEGAIYYTEDILEKLPKDQPLLIYCTLGVRSNKAAKIASNKGFKEVYDMKDGILGWANGSLPLMNQDGLSTDTVHTYNKSVSSMLKKGTAVY